MGKTIKSLGDFVSGFPHKFVVFCMTNLSYYAILKEKFKNKSMDLKGLNIYSLDIPQSRSTNFQLS